MRINVEHSVKIPDPIRLERYRRVPELGPRVLFFSGGTALRRLSSRLVDYTHNSIHLITPFDSGGSSAVIRKAFQMLAVGDIRNRIMALADQSVHGNPEVYDLFSYRFPHDADNDTLKKKLDRMANAKDTLVSRVPNPMCRIIRNHLHAFLEQMPAAFDLRGGSVGNLIIASGYLNNRRHIEPVIYMFSKLVEARGTVRPVTGLSYHLRAELSGKEMVSGQHLLTGDRFGLYQKKLKKLFLIKTLESKKKAQFAIKRKTADLIKSAELICYPFGSFYTSLIATLLPLGVGQAVSETNAPKVYVPNPVPDPEQFGMDLYDCVKTIVRYARDSGGKRTPVERLLHFVVIDSKRGNYNGPVRAAEIEALGVRVIDGDLLQNGRVPVFNDERLIEVLLSLV